jgi:hypothetical protein
MHRQITLLRGALPATCAEARGILRAAARAPTSAVIALARLHGRSMGGSA